MREAQKPDHVGLNSLLGYLKDGRYMVPDFQREFEWKARDIRDLTRSIFLDYYIGSLLLWRGTSQNFASLSCEPIYGQKAGKPDYIVLDGQQRLTAINYAFVAPDKPLPRGKQRALYFLRVDRFIAENFEEAFDYWRVAPGRGDGLKGAAAVFGSPESQFSRHIFPLAVIGNGGWELFEWMRGYKEHWSEVAKTAADEQDRAQAAAYAANAVGFGDHVKSITEKFQISFIELDRELEIDRVCDIFTQINSKGIRLDVFDLMNALLKPKDVKLKELWRDAAPRLEFVESAKMNVYILQVMSILKQTYCNPKFLYYLLPGAERRTRGPDGTLERQVMIADAADFRARWSHAVRALERAIARLRQPQEFGVSKASYLPYVSILPVFAAALATVEEQQPGNRFAAEGRFRLWYWASIFANRYSGSTETTAARDIQDLRAWFADGEAEPAVVAGFRGGVDKLELRSEVKKGNAIYNAIFNLAVIAGARDWSSGQIPPADELDDHHIVPKSWGTKHLGGSTIDTILNRTPLTAETNRAVIGDRLPNAYLPELIATNGRATVEALMASHFISPAGLDVLLRDPFRPDDFDAFLRERQRTIGEAIRSLLIGGRADLPADLRALDQDVERVELALRGVVVKALHDDPAGLPPHIRARLDERIDKHLKKHPGTDPTYYATLTGALEYADLREIEGVMVRGATAAYFADRFPHKEGLIAKFSQLAELRNGIRHSRATSEVVRKEGEASILWFDTALQTA